MNSYSSSKKKKKSQIDAWSVMGLLFAALFLFVSPFYRGLFNGGSSGFEKPIFSFILISGIFLMIMAVYYFKQKFELHSLHDLLMLWVWLIPLMFILSLFFSVDHYLATNAVFINIVYAILFSTGVFLSKQRSNHTLILYTVMLSAYMLVVFGLLNWFGLVHYKDAYYFARLGNVFQYPDTNAAVLLGLLYAAVMAMMRSQSLLLKLLHACMLSPIFISFLLTYSRGALLLLPIMLVLTLLLFGLKNQLRMMLHLLITAVLSALILNKVVDLGLSLNKAYTNSDFYLGIGLMILIAVLVSALTLLLEYMWMKKPIPFINKLDAKKYIRWCIPGFLVIISVISIVVIFAGNASYLAFLPDSIKARLQSINFEEASVMARLAYYKDGFHLLKDYPILGAGGGSWSILYSEYQSIPYTSRQTHSFLMQYANEIGIVGSIVLLGFIAFIYYHFIKGKIVQKHEDEINNIFIVIPTALLLHSLLDFNLSFVYIGVLVFFCLGLTAGSTDIKLSISAKRASLFKIVFPSLLVVVALSTLYFSFTSLKGAQYYQLANTELNQTKQINDNVINYVDKALSMRSYHPEYALLKIQLHRQIFAQTKDTTFYQSAESVINDFEEAGKLSPLLFDQKVQLYLANNQTDEALSILQEKLLKSEWVLSLYEQIIKTSFNAGEGNRGEKNADEVNKYWNVAEKYYNVLNEKVAYYHSLPKGLQIETFEVTPSISLSMGRIYFIKGDYAKAEQILKSALPQEAATTIDKDILLWYAAALKKQGKEDQAVLDLIQKHTEELNQIMNLSLNE